MRRRCLRRGGCNGEEINAATAIDLWWLRWSHGGENGSTAEIFKRWIARVGDNLVVATGITAVVVVIVRLSGGVW